MWHKGKLKIHPIRVFFFWRWIHLYSDRFGLHILVCYSKGKDWLWHKSQSMLAFTRSLSPTERSHHQIPNMASDWWWFLHLYSGWRVQQWQEVAVPVTCIDVPQDGKARVYGGIAWDITRIFAWHRSLSLISSNSMFLGVITAICWAVVAHWTAGQQVEWSILHQRHDS